MTHLDPEERAFANAKRQIEGIRGKDIEELQGDYRYYLRKVGENDPFILLGPLSQYYTAVRVALEDRDAEVPTTGGESPVEKLRRQLGID